LNPFADPVTKKPPIASKINSIKSKFSTPIRYPAVAEITTVRDSLNFNN
jgi:hypothetical protein